jgi:hypothetical protein
MATEKTALTVSELDFMTIRENLKTFLRSQDAFADYDFEGSGMAVLLDLLAYNTHYQAFYLNMIANEMFLDSAQLRESVLSHGKLVKYIPNSKQGALSRLNLTVTPSESENQETASLTIEKYTKLLGTDIDGINYPFVALYSNTASKSGGSFAFSNVFVKQGEVVTLQYLMQSSNDTRRFEIPSANVDTTSIVITVQDSASNADTTLYSRANDITELTANSTVYFVEENENEKYTFYFGDNVIGKRPRDGNIIICTYLDTVGSISNNITGFTFIEPLGGLFSDNISITSAVSSYGGIDKETVEDVRFRAPYYYSSQNRAVIAQDYESLLMKDYGNNIDSVSVWGGEDNDPVIYGKVFISMKTRGNYALTNFEKERIKEELIAKRSVMTVTPEIVDPDYVYIQVIGKVNYDPTLTSKSSNELKALVVAAIQDYTDDELNKFRSVFRKAKLQSYIEAADKSITSSDIDVKVQKRIQIDTTQTKTYTLNYNLPLRKSIYTDRMSSYPEIEMYDAAGVSRDVFIEETPEASTGIAEIVIEDSGRGFTSTPTITIVGDGSGARAEARILSGRLEKITITDAGQNYSYAQVLITGGDGGVEAVATAKLQARKGTLRTYYYRSSDGEKVIVNPNIGTIDYDTGALVLNSMRIYSVAENDFYEDDYLTVNIHTDNDNIPILRNRILTIDTEDPRSIQIDVVSD